MGKDENGAASSKRDHHRKSPSESEPDPDEDSDELSRKSERNRKKSSNKKSSTRTYLSKRKRSRDSESYTSSSYSGSDSYDSDSESDSDSSRRRRKERKRREEKKERRRREKEKEKKRKRKEDEKRKKKKKEKGKKGAVTNSWGKYGIIKETDMWNKRPEFTAWLLEVKKVNLESLPNWEEKQMFKDFMEDHNTATFPSKKYYNLDAYHHHKMEKEMKKAMKKGFTKVQESERTIFNDEEIRRLELQREREKQKEEQLEALKRSMQSGMAQAMKEQAQLREEMAYQYKLGNSEAAAAIQRRLDPDVAM